MNCITFPSLDFSVFLAQLKRILDAVIADVPGGVKSGSLGKKTAGFSIVTGWGVPLCRFHVVPVKNEKATVKSNSKK